MKYLLQSPEGTPTSTSGSNAPPGKPAEGAPEGAPDVGHRVTDEPVVDDAVDWAGLDAPDDALPEDEVPPNGEEPEPTGEEPAAPPPSQPAGKPAAKPEGEPSTPPSGQPGKEGQPGDQPGKEPAQPPAQQPETAEQKAAREKAQAEAEKKDFDSLRDYYKLPDDYVERLRTEPELVLPELAAKVHQAVFRGMQQYMTQAVPQFLQMHSQVQEANTKTKEAFFGRWPSLKSHEAQVLQIAGMFVQMNPKATSQERLEKVGQLACAALGISPDPAPGKGTPPARPGKGTPPAEPGRTFRPSNPSGSSSAAPPPSENEFTKMADEMLEDDQGQ